jgi:hypothetical protein
MTENDEGSLLIWLTSINGDATHDEPLVTSKGELR